MTAGKTTAQASAAALALDLFSRAAHTAYGGALAKLVLFGSRPRGDARSDSDIDVAVILRDVRDRRAERDRLADLAYDAIVETGLDIQTVPISVDEWEYPEHHTNPALIRAIKRDGIVVEPPDDPRPAEQSAALG